MTVYIAEADFAGSMDKIEKLVTTLEQSTDIIKSVDSWYPSFQKFADTSHDVDIPDTVLGNATFHKYLNQFLYNIDPDSFGLRFIPNFEFKNEAESECGNHAAEILLSSFTFTHVQFAGTETNIPAMNKVKQIIRDCQFDGQVFPFNRVLDYYICNWILTLNIRSMLLGRQML